MPRRIRVGEVKTRFLDTLLLVLSISAIIASIVSIYFLVTTLPQFYLVPFGEFSILFILGIFGIRLWQKETAI